MNPVLSIGPQPSNVQDIGYQAAWDSYIVDEVRPAMNLYFQRFQARLTELGFRVTILESSNDTPYLLVPPYWSGTMEKSGIVAGWTMTLGQAQSRDPEAFAEHYASWVWGQAARASGNESTWNPPAVTPTSPATVTPAGRESVQQQQAPPTPDAGTLTNTPPVTAVVPSDQLQTFYEWNWIAEQRTGRPGPSPAEVGVSNPSADMTLMDWKAATGAWYAGTTGTTGGAGGPGSGVPTPSPSPAPAPPADGGVVSKPLTDQEKLMLGGAAVVLLLIALK